MGWTMCQPSCKLQTSDDVFAESIGWTRQLTTSFLHRDRVQSCCFQSTRAARLGDGRLSLDEPQQGPARASTGQAATASPATPSTSCYANMTQALQHVFNSVLHANEINLLRSSLAQDVKIPCDKFMSGDITLSEKMKYLLQSLH
jgi:hypothetical protein